MSMLERLTFRVGTNLMLAVFAVNLMFCPV